MRDYLDYVLCFSISLNVGLIACLMDSRQEQPPQDATIRIIPPQEDTVITVLAKRPLSPILY